jgi:adenosylhomocysteinase
MHPDSYTDFRIRLDPESPSTPVAMTLAEARDCETFRALAVRGREALDEARRSMAGLLDLAEDVKTFGVLFGVTIIGAVHVSAQTGVFIELLKQMGARPRWCSCNPASTSEEVAAALVDAEIPIFAWRRETTEDFEWCLHQVLNGVPETGMVLVVDDGGDLVRLLHQPKWAHLAPRVRGATEQTTSGVNAATRRADTTGLRFPVMMCNNSPTKSLFDNRRGCWDSFLDGLRRVIDFTIAGSECAVFGYGCVGKGIAQGLRNVGGVVLIVEVDPICALQARMDGQLVVSSAEAVARARLIVTATGCREVVSADEFQHARDGAILCNMGHDNVEIDMHWLSVNATRTRVKPYVDRYHLADGRSVVVLAEGRLVNLVCGPGHTSSIMSLTFAVHLAALDEFASNHDTRRVPGIYKLPLIRDEDIARRHLKHLGGTLSKLATHQAEYLGIAQNGPFKNDQYFY